MTETFYFFKGLAYSMLQKTKKVRVVKIKQKYVYCKLKELIK